MGVQILGILLILGIIAWAEQGTFKQLPDGLLVRKIDTLQHTTARWSLIITIDKPSQNEELLKIMRAYIKNLEKVEKPFQLILTKFTNKVIGGKIININLFENIREWVSRSMKKIERKHRTRTIKKEKRTF